MCIPGQDDACLAAACCMQMHPAVLVTAAPSSASSSSLPPIDNCNYACNNIDRVQQQWKQRREQGAGTGSWTLIAQAERKICTAIYIMRILFFLWPHLFRHPPFESPRAIFILLPSLCNKVSTFLLYGCGFASTANWTWRRPQLMLMLRLNLMRSVVKLLKATHTHTT